MLRVIEKYCMNEIDRAIVTINKAICENISKFDVDERGLLSQNILSQLRNLVDHVALKIYSQGKDIEDNYPNIEKAISYVKSRGNLKFLSKLYDFLQISASHYTVDGDSSERLLLKYYEYLLRIKSFLIKTYKIEILQNISEFPIKTDPEFNIYYEKIAEQINLSVSRKHESPYEDRYYIQKIKPFFVNFTVYYEITFTPASDGSSKFDRFIAFTKLDISPNYAVKLSVSAAHIQILGKKMPIYIIDNWDVSIRPCELNNFSLLFGNPTNINTGLVEYRLLMRYLRTTGLNLVDVINLSDKSYEGFKEFISGKSKTSYFLNTLDFCRTLIINNASGSVVIKYLLFKLNNKVIRRQRALAPCDALSNLCLKYGCIPFDQMPFCTSLIEHNPRLVDLFDCLDVSGREHELFARFVQNNIEIHGKLFTPLDEITTFQYIKSLVQNYNRKLYYKHAGRSLDVYKRYIYIREYEENTLTILNKLMELSSTGIKNYTASVDSWLKTTSHLIDCEEKKEKLRQLFENSTVALIYGSAGTGKSTFIDHISSFFDNFTKLYLANTNPAVDNLKRRVVATQGTFMTITKFLSKNTHNTVYDVLIIDECSTVSNDLMVQLLSKASFKLLILVGDVFQIESIRFGNWFGMARYFVPDTAVFELTNPWRTKNNKLLKLWDKVRNSSEEITEHIARSGYSTKLDDSIFEHTGNDEIILCLNYDGLYGINNINKFIQENNNSKCVQWGVQTYKVNDPILFNESERFAPVIYNNMKGKIVDAVPFEDRVQFDIELEKALNALEAYGLEFQLLNNSANGNSIIRFYVKKYRSTDDDDDMTSDAIVPFQVAYAVSIHKAQGLEYDSVKVVITDEVDELITHDIFYTAITRAKNELKIYWTPETEKKVLGSLEKRNSKRDALLLSAKYNIRLH